MPGGEVNLALHPFWIKYTIPTDNRADFDKLLEAEAGYLKGTLREYGDTPSKLLEHEDGFKNLRLFRSLQKLNAILSLVQNEIRQGAYSRVLMFAKHATTMKTAQIAMEKYKVKTLYPKSNPIKAETDLDRFNRGESKTRVYISSIVAANRLNFARFVDVPFVIFLDTEFDPNLNIGALERVAGEKNICPKLFFVRRHG